jgi:hypothetical protein
MIFEYSTLIILYSAFGRTASALLELLAIEHAAYMTPYILMMVYSS